VFRTYEVCNPVVLAKTLAALRAHPHQLAFILDRELARVELGHTRLWQFTYPLTFLVPLNFLYLYARRLTVHNANLHAAMGVGFEHAEKALVGEGVETAVMTQPVRPQASAGETLLTGALETLSPRPGLATQAQFLSLVGALVSRNEVTVERHRFGYRMRRMA